MAHVRECLPIPWSELKPALLVDGSIEWRAVGKRRHVQLRRQDLERLWLYALGADCRGR